MMRVSVVRERRDRTTSPTNATRYGSIWANCDGSTVTSSRTESAEATPNATDIAASRIALPRQKITAASATKPRPLVIPSVNRLSWPRLSWTPASAHSVKHQTWARIRARVTSPPAERSASGCSPLAFKCRTRIECRDAHTAATTRSQLTYVSTDCPDRTGPSSGILATTPRSSVGRAGISAPPSDPLTPNHVRSR
jgi:hypothetical protein